MKTEHVEGGIISRTENRCGAGKRIEQQKADKRMERLIIISDGEGYIRRETEGWRVRKNTMRIIERRVDNNGSHVDNEKWIQG